MSIVIEVFPQCDFCEETYPDTRQSTVKDCRKYCMDDWKKVKGKDMCPDCQKEKGLYK